MFEARIKQGAVLKKVLDSVKDLVTDANFEADPVEGFKLQAMDSSHVSLVSLKLHADGFEHYRCDRALTMGMNLANMVRRSASSSGRRGAHARGARRFPRAIGSFAVRGRRARCRACVTPRDVAWGMRRRGTVKENCLGRTARSRAVMRARARWTRAMQLTDEFRWFDFKLLAGEDVEVRRER